MQLIVALAVSTFSVSAADKLSLSLQQAMDMAVERNNTLANAALDVKIAKANKWAAIAQMLPQISASGDYSNFMGYEMDLRGMTIAMPPYVTLGVRSSLTFTPALLVNTQISEISRKMSDISLQQSEQDITNQVKTLYLSALVSEEVLNLLGRNLECLERLHDMTMTSVRVGASEQTAADQIEVQVAQLKNSIASSKRTIEMTYNSMRLLLDVDVDTELDFTDTLDRLMETDDYLALVSEDFDLERNYAWQLANKSTELAKKQLDATIMSGLPSLTAYHQYSYKEYLSKDANVMNMTPPNMVGATLSVPLFTSLQQTTYNAQKQNLEVTQRVFDNISRRYEQGYSSAMDLTNTGTTLINAQSTYVQSIMEFLNARIALEKLLNK